MFWRLVFQLLRGSRARLTVAILALVSGAAVISGLLNLDFGVEYQLTQQFRTLGANIVIAPRAAPSLPESGPSNPALMNEAELSQVQANIPPRTPYSPFTYVVARAEGNPVVAVGAWLDQLQALNPTWKMEGNWVASRDDSAACLIGRNASRQLHLATGSALRVQYLNQTAECRVSGILDAGAADDNQVFMNLRALQSLAGLGGKVSLVQLSVNGGPAAAATAASQLTNALPEVEVRPIREVTDAEGHLLGRIRLLIVSMIVLILILTALCVLATMAALAMERRADVGLMKALGGSIGRIAGIFIAEVGVLGALGGIIGAALGAGLSYWMGLRVFEAAIPPRWEVFPITVLTMTVVAMAGALPLRALGAVKPASILRGE
ncbi:MAG TPA: ABC transporter permease [Candidatus Acidoferrales bacterium]